MPCTATCAMSLMMAPGLVKVEEKNVQRYCVHKDDNAMEQCCSILLSMGMPKSKLGRQPLPNHGKSYTFIGSHHVTIRRTNCYVGLGYLEDVHSVLVSLIISYSLMQDQLWSNPSTATSILYCSVSLISNYGQLPRYSKFSVTVVE